MSVGAESGECEMGYAPLKRLNCKDEKYHPLSGAHPTKGAAGKWLNQIGEASSDREIGKRRL
jgi:hypothetical protein